MDKIKLFCFPFAGGSAMTFLSYKRYLNDKIELKPIELAGRGKRINEPLYGSMEEVIEDVFSKVQNEIHDAPYAFLGHSMGTIIMYELVKKIRMHKLQEPMHVFFSGRFSPLIKSLQESKYLLPDDEFIDEVAKLGGMSEEILNNRELISLFLPIIKADYKIVELYKCNEDGFKLNCDLTILNGKFDKIVSQYDMKRWEECTDKKCTFYEFDGGHFFINEFREEIIGIISDTLLKLANISEIVRLKA